MADGIIDSKSSDLPNEQFDDQTHVNHRHQHNLIKRNRSETPAATVGLLPSLSEEDFISMMETEKEHLPREDYLSRLKNGNLDMAIRKEALDWISKAQSYYKFGPFSICLSMNYFDRFLSMYELPSGKSWAIQLLAVACLSIAAKMEETTIPLIVDLQVGEPKFVFEGKTIQRMELLVMNTLKWRMKAYTPCSFIDFFLRIMKEDQEFINFDPMISKSLDIILTITKGIDFLEFRPSEIAGAVALFVLRETTQGETTLNLSCLLDKERVLKCLEVIMKDLKMKSWSSSSSYWSSMVGEIMRSPNGVLEVTCLSHKSDDTTNYSNSHKCHKRQ
ncbi:cyclin-D4-1-like [Impatiens glandulifera]|uniref:cyclin-D4-1-like n=1 Tax=Impatiens glandulifera TaxID=253017 RepID=UPI001FB120CD|nr:cyclin-D4-1-like [Impatiens glandulifera]